MPIYRVSSCWCCTTTRLRSEGGGKWCCQREQGLVEVAIDNGLLSGCMDRAGRSGLRAPAELSIAVVLLLELPMDVTEVE